MEEYKHKFNESPINQDANETNTCDNMLECQLTFIGIKNFPQLYQNYYLPIFISKLPLFSHLYSLGTKKKFRFSKGIFVFSVIGIILNTLNIIILSSKNFKEKFNKYLNIYSLNSLILNLNDLIFYSLYFVPNDDFKYLYSFAFFYSHIYLVIWSISYSFAGVLDIFIIYERIQQFNPSIKFLLKKKACVISSWVLAYCIVINIPLNLSRKVTLGTFIMVSNLSHYGNTLWINYI